VNFLVLINFQKTFRQVLKACLGLFFFHHLLFTSAQAGEEPGGGGGGRN
jgi:hypothetical protein